MFGADTKSPKILGLEVGATVVRAVVLDRGSGEVTAAAEASIEIDNDDGFDANAIRPALGEVVYQLAELQPGSMLAAISIGPPQSGVGSGPALPPWLERQARSLGQNLICAGDLGVAFCPQSPVDLLISLCEEAAITVARVDLAPIAAARMLTPGVDTIMVGSGRGWRARLRSDEVLEALHTDDIDIDQPLSVVGPDGRVIEVEKYHRVGVARALDDEFELNLGQLAAATGAAVGIIDSSPANLLDGATVVGRPVRASGAYRMAATNASAAGAGSGKATNSVDSVDQRAVDNGAGPGVEAVERSGIDPTEASLQPDDTPGALAATARHSFVVDDLAPPTVANGVASSVSTASPTSYQLGNGVPFVPGSGMGRTTVDLTRSPTPPEVHPDGAFEPSRSPVGTPGRPSVRLNDDFDDVYPGVEQGRLTFPITLAVLVVLIGAVALFLAAR